MKVLVTGAKGQLGYDVCKRLDEVGIAYVGIDREECDLTDESRVQQVFASLSPTSVIHCAAYTAVDKAETELIACQRVNVDATINVAVFCKQYSIPLLYISTDYVFSGTGDLPFEVTSAYEPQNVYGRTKAEGELVVKQFLSNYFIVRISWVFGKNGKNFVDTMRKLGAEKNELTVVADQIGSPTYTCDLAVLLVDMIQTEKYGVYHATNEGFCSWAEFANEIMRVSGLHCNIVPVTSDKYPTAAKRPLNSRLSKASLEQSRFQKLPHWSDALKRYLESIDY